MDSFNSIGDAIVAIRDFDRAKFADLPEAVQTVLNDTAGVGISPVDRIVKVGEAIFARRDEIKDKDALLLAGKLVEYAATNGWHGLAVDGRADRIQRTLQKAAGVKGVTIAAADVPEPSAEFAQPPEPTPPTPEPTAPPSAGA